MEKYTYLGATVGIGHCTLWSELGILHTAHSDASILQKCPWIWSQKCKCHCSELTDWTIYIFEYIQNGLFSALPYLSQALVASSIGFLCDHLYRNGFTLPTLRKSFNTIAFAGTAICLFIIPFIGRDRFMNILLLIIALGINGMSMAGFTVTHVDMSPNYAGTLMGITNCIANFAGVLAPMTVGFILSWVVGDETESTLVQERTLQAWSYVFYLTAAIFVFTGVIYALFGSNVLQKWNDPQKKQLTNIPTKYVRKTDEWLNHNHKPGRVTLSNLSNFSFTKHLHCL